MEVVIDHDGDEKYIVCGVTDAKGKLRMCLVSLPLEYHSDIAEEFKRHLSKGERITRVFGGGILTIDREAKVIRTYGMSGGYGKPKLEQVQQLLDSEFGDDWDVTVTITSEIRG
eukprot:TRINITY_DN3317_c0_g1_i1.p1 TRINITY_DN3317_c0_g1~~TRINITY_DN3317_c0_g1_i1.p1  ORF type:complete len:114 (+),score=31.10 TRINITY_DN3317_c0_g1_i1:96-437(+)